MRWLLRSAALASVLMASDAVAGDGSRTVWLHPVEGKAIAVATLAVSDAGAFALEWDESLFTDHFLSMRPFKCLEGSEKLWCRAPYPYDNARRIKGDDLTDLEYDLIFVWKGAGEYGIDMWNGIYYVLDETGDAIHGTLHEVSLDLLASPPESPGEILIGPMDLEEGDPDSHWLPRLTIE